MSGESKTVNSSTILIADLDPKVRDIVSKLKFLSKIDKHEKLDVASLSLVADTWYNNLFRLAKTVAASQGFIWKTVESRKTALEFIETTTNEALGLAKELFSQTTTTTNTFHRSLGQMIVATLEELDIESLKATYASDRMFISKVETFQDVLKNQLLELKRVSANLEPSPASSTFYSTSVTIPPSPQSSTTHHPSSNNGSSKSLTSSSPHQPSDDEEEDKEFDFSSDRLETLEKSRPESLRSEMYGLSYEEQNKALEDS
jgi:hypothetical protein